MTSLQLQLRFDHKTHACFLKSNMPVNDMKQKVKEQLGIKADGFEIRLRDELYNENRILDDEFIEDLSERLPYVTTETLIGEIIPDIALLVNQLDKETMSNKSVCIITSDWNPTDNDNRAPEEVSMFHHQDNEPECFAKLLATIPEEEPDDIFSSNDDEINRNICQSQTSLSSNEDRFYSIEMTNYEAQVVIENVVDIIAQQRNNTGAIPVESSEANWYDRNSPGLFPDLPNQIVQERPSVPLSSSLQFIHDVQPYQKTQYTISSFDKCSDKDIPSYVMRIQGAKTNADKGKSILPRLKLPRVYNTLHRRHKMRFDLVVALIREEKIDNKRLLYACEDIQFLPNNTNKDIDAVNPIKLNLPSLAIDADGTFKLSLRLINKSRRTSVQRNKNRLFHTIDEEIARTLHSKPYDPQFFRLACALVEGNNTVWNTLCLSDYIRPKQQLQT